MGTCGQCFVLLCILCEWSTTELHPWCQDAERCMGESKTDFRHEHDAQKVAAQTRVEQCSTKGLVMLRIKSPNLWERLTLKYTIHTETTNAQYKVIYVETLNRENHENKDSTIQREYRMRSEYNTLHSECISRTGLLASNLARLWRRSHSLTLSLPHSLLTHTVFSITSTNKGTHSILFNNTPCLP